MSMATLSAAMGSRGEVGDARVERLGDEGRAGDGGVGRADGSVKAGLGGTHGGPDGQFQLMPRSQSAKHSQGTEAPKGQSISETIFHDLGRTRPERDPLKGTHPPFPR